MDRAHLISILPLLVLLLVAAGIDLRSRRIPNWLNLTLLTAGLIQSFTALHTISPGQATLGILAGFGLTFVLFAMGALGGGDVKLLAAVGAWTGPAGVLFVFCAAGIAGMIIVVSQALWQKRLNTLVHNSALLAINLVHVNQVGMDHAIATGKSTRSIARPLPYAVPVLVGVVTLLLWPK
jgi:prepilin peptidase CpaA